MSEIQTEDFKVKIELPKSKIESLTNKRVMSIVRRSHGSEVRLTNPTDFFKKMSEPIEGRLHKWMSEVATSTEEALDTSRPSVIVEINTDNGKWRWRKINNTSELRELLKSGQKAYDIFMKLREANYNKAIRGREDFFGGFGFSDEGTSFGGSQASFPARPEYTPLIGTPFYKQLYLADYWEMHSKCFWYSNYSGIGKFIVDTTRNFVMGRGFNVSFKDQKAQDAWAKYEERSNIYEESRLWCDDLTKFGENMLKRIPTPKGIIHRSFDPSTVWEIVTDPEDIYETGIKYYHQQYNTQYQIFTDKKAPTSKYIINQLPPELVLHTKVNVTAYEKRGRSDLLAPLLYFKYYEDYMQAKLIRAKNEAAFIWDVSIEGSDEDVQAYINSTESIADVPPGSENVHNAAIKRSPLSPQFGAKGVDETSNELLSYVAMSTSIPFTYFGTSHTSGGTKAGALVSTEPVVKKMIERQLKMEFLIRKIVIDVLIDAKLDPKTEFEVNFPEIMEADSSQKIQDLSFARTEGAISHRRMSEMISKELKITNYDYDTEQKDIALDSRNDNLFNIPDLTPDAGNPQDMSNDRDLNRPEIKKQDSAF